MTLCIIVAHMVIDWRHESAIVIQSGWKFVLDWQYNLMLP